MTERGAGISMFGVHGIVVGLYIMVNASCWQGFLFGVVAGTIGGVAFQYGATE